VPPRDNDAHVVIPQGVVATLADTLAAHAGDAPVLASLTGAGGVQIHQATLAASGAVSLGSVAVGADAELSAGSLATGSLAQTGGRIAVAGTLAVDGAFAQSAGVIRAGGAATIVQAEGDLRVNHLVADGLTLAASRGALVIGNIGSVGDASLQAAGSITQAEGGSITVLGAADLVAGGNVVLGQSRNMIVGAVTAQGADVQLTQGLDDLVLGNVMASGNLAVNAAAGSIRQAAGSALTVAGTTQAAAPQGSVYLMATGNRFGGAVSASGSDIGITQGQQALVLGEVAASGNLAIASGGAVSQASKLTVAGKTSVDGGSHGVTLDNEANDFTGAVSVRSGALTLVDGADGLALGNLLTSGATLVNAKGGPIVQYGGVFAPAAGSPVAAFNAWLDGVYTAVGVNTSAAVMINGQLVSDAAGPAVSRGVASALSALKLPSAGVPAADAPQARQSGAVLAIPVVVPVSVD
jgi:hypothetical protein